MANSNKRSNITAAIAILLLVGSVIYLTVEIGMNNRLEDSLKNEKLTAESLLSEKLLLDKEILKIKSELKALEGKNSELDKILKSTTERLETADRDLKRSKNQSATVAQLKKQNKELSKLKDDFEQQLSNLKTSLKQLQSANDNMTKTVSLLQEENKNLKNELEATRMASLNDVLIETAKRNNKLTVNAKKTKKLTITVNVSTQVENLKLKITRPDGKELPSTDGDITVKVLASDVKKPQAFFAGTNSTTAQYKRVELVYVPKVKLIAGTYKIEILDDSKSIGSLQVRLR